MTTSHVVSDASLGVVGASDGLGEITAHVRSKLCVLDNVFVLERFDHMKDFLADVEFVAECNVLGDVHVRVSDLRTIKSRKHV